MQKLNSALTFSICKSTLIKNHTVCPVCGHMYIANGFGPQNNKKLTWALQSLLFLSSRKFRLPAIAHDISYLVVPYMKMSYKEGTYEKICANRKDCDDLFLDLMLAEANNSYPWMKAYYKKAAQLAYDLVREGGEDSFKHSHKSTN